MKNKYGIVIVVLLLLGCKFSGGINGGNSGQSNPTPKNTTAELVEADAIRLDYVRSKDAAIAKYNNREITVRGKVVTVSTFAGTAFEGTAVLDIANSFEGELEHGPYILCDVDKADFPAFKDVKDDDVVTVKGMLHANDAMLKIMSCKLVSSK